MLELLIKNATVLDGTGAEGFVADIGISGGKIVSLGACAEAADRVIDASGLTLTPGFIDSHSHSDNAILSYPDQREKIEQGITFSLAGQCGGSAAPARTKEGELISPTRFYEEATALPQGSSCAMFIGHGALRRAVMGLENRAPTKEETEQMKALLREGLEAGAIGLSFGLIYAPSCYAEQAECTELAKVVGEYGGLLSAHIRNEGDTLLDAVEEFLQIVRESGCRAVFSHHKSAGRKNWGKVKLSLALINAAVRKGLDVYQDVYPYVASATSLIATYIPKAFHPQGMQGSALALLDDPEIAERIRANVHERWGNDLSFTLLTSCPNCREYEGMDLNQVADAMGLKDRADAAFAILRKTEGRAQACYFTMCEEDVEYVISHPRTMICTDSSVAKENTHFHPRLRASFPRAIARYVRERGVVSLPEMIRKMTSLPASVYRLSGKGKIEVGADADICIFDAERLSDKADFTACTLKNEGLAYVILNGRVVVEDGVYNGERAGRVYRMR